MVKVLEVQKSSYYKWEKCPESKRKKEDKVLGKKIKEVFEVHKERYGAPI